MDSQSRRNKESTKNIIDREINRQIQILLMENINSGKGQQAAITELFFSFLFVAEGAERPQETKWDAFFFLLLKSLYSQKNVCWRHFSVLQSLKNCRKAKRLIRLSQAIILAKKSAGRRVMTADVWTWATRANSRRLSQWRLARICGDQTRVSFFVSSKNLGHGKRRWEEERWRRILV